MNLLLGSLVCAALYLGHGWVDSRSQNLQLRGQIAALKRQLASRRS